MSLSFDLSKPGSAGKKTGGFDLYPDGDSVAVCWAAMPGSETREQKIDSKGPEDTPEPGKKLKGWGHVHQNTNTGDLFKDHGNDDFDWKPCEPTYEFKFIQFFFCQKSDYESTYVDGKPELDDEGNTVKRPSGAWIRSRKMTASAAANSALRNFLKNWGVQVPAPDAWEELKSFDIRAETVGRPAALKVAHTKGTKHTFANIDTCHPVK